MYLNYLFGWNKCVYDDGSLDWGLPFVGSLLGSVSKIESGG